MYIFLGHTIIVSILALAMKTVSEAKQLKLVWNQTK